MQIFQLWAERFRFAAFLSVVSTTLLGGGAISKVSADASPNTSAMVVTLTGLQITDVVIGTGPAPKLGQICVINYRSWLSVNGGSRDNAGAPIDSGQAVQFALGKGQVRREWDEGVATMRVGGRRTIVVPAQVGLGAFSTMKENPREETRFANAQTQLPGLIFEIELLDVK